MSTRIFQRRNSSRRFLVVTSCEQVANSLEIDDRMTPSTEQRPVVDHMDVFYTRAPTAATAFGLVRGLVYLLNETQPERGWTHRDFTVKPGIDHTYYAWFVS